MILTYVKLLFIEMEEIKEIVLNRISDIQQIKCIVQLSHSELVQKLAFYRDREVHRCRRQNQILSQLRKKNHNSYHRQDLQDMIVAIVSAYDPEILVAKDEQVSSAIYKFFNKNAYRCKNQHLRVLFSQKLDFNAYVLLISWLSQWSCKKYSQSLIKQLYHLSSRKTSHQPKKSLISNSLSLNKSHDKQIVSKQIKKNDQQTQKMKINQKMIIICNRNQIYGYMIQDLQEYYRLVDIEEVDLCFAKKIKKRGRNKKILQNQNIDRAVSILCDSKQNSQVKGFIKDYYDTYSIYQQKCRKLTAVKQDSRGKKLGGGGSLGRKQTNNFPTNKSTPKSQGDMDKKNVNFNFLQNRKQGKRKQLDKFRSPEYIRIQDKLKSNQSNQKMSLKLPMVHYSGRKQHIKWEQKCTVRFPTQNLSEENNEQQIQFSQRSKLRGVMIKNYLSSRQSSKQLNFKPLKRKSADITNEVSKKQLVIHNISSSNDLQRQNSVDHRYIYRPDLCSLRNKTKAFLKNLKNVQKYQNILICNKQ